MPGRLPADTPVTGLHEGARDETVAGVRSPGRGDRRAKCVGGGSGAGRLQECREVLQGRAESKGVEAFASLYGTNTNKKNAYGKCVSKTANVKAEAREDASETKAAVAACKKQKADDAATFAEQYKNLGQCIKAGKTSTD